jgi:predicted ATP-grasp superfamily ATP-dependent carboligase
VTPDELSTCLGAVKLDTAVLFPCTDEWCTAVAALPDRTAARFPSSTAPAETLATFLDKWRFAECLRELGVPHPATVCIGSIEDAEALPDALFQGAFLKPRNSQTFSRRFKAKGMAVDGRRQALEAVRSVLDAGCSVMLQEYIPGPPTEHLFVDGFVDRQGRMSWLARRRLRMHPPRFGNSSLTESIAPDEAASAVASLTRVFAATAFRGLFDAEFKRDPRDGRFTLIEVNPRAWWQLAFAEHCGLPVCAMAYEDALGRSVDPVTAYRVGVRGLILSQDVQAFLHHRREDRMSAASWLRSCLGAHELVFAWNDPLPAVAQWLAGLRAPRRDVRPTAARSSGTRPPARKATLSWSRRESSIL